MPRSAPAIVGLRPSRVAALLMALVVGAVSGCASGAGDGERLARVKADTTTTAAPPVAPPRPSLPPAADPETDPGRAGPDVVEIRYRLERRVSDPATAGFAEVVEATLSDPRGWSGAGFRLVPDPDAEYSVVLAEGPEVDDLCRPYETWSTYSCQNGPVVALNADRWRSATPQWTGDLDTYRQMLVNHEVGHLLGQHHRRCTEAGEAAAVMVQQSTNLKGCRPNPWPLDFEVERAARHDLPLAPPFDRTDHGDDW